MSLRNVVHPLAGSLVVVRAKQCNRKERGVGGQGAQRILNRGSRILKERAKFMYERGNAGSKHMFAVSKNLCEECNTVGNEIVRSAYNQVTSVLKNLR
jgi:hypothetical protein